MGRGAWSLADANPELCADREIVLRAVALDGRALMFASDELRCDRDVVLCAVKQNGGALEYAFPGFKDDEEIWNAAMEQQGGFLAYAANRAEERAAAQMQMRSEDVGTDLHAPQS